MPATAVTGQLAWCPAQKRGPSGSTETVVVQCYLKGGVPGFVPFTVTFSASSGAVAGAGLLYAYVHGTSASVAAPGNPAGGVNTVTALSPGEWPAPPGISFGTAGGVNTVTRAGLAPSLVRFPPAGLKPDTMLVTARDPGARSAT